MALNTEYERREREVLDQAIDAALAASATGDEFGPVTEAELDAARVELPTADAPPEVTEDLEIIARWLYRRYAIKNDRFVTWERQGGKVKGPWYGDAQGILDALAVAQKEG